MNPSTKSAYHNEPMLKRQARIRPRRDLQASTSAAPLSMILEEDDAANLSSSSASSATKDLKSRRRRANIISDPFHLTFTQVTYPFPHPPVPTPSSMPPSICPPSPGSSSPSTSATPSPYSSPRSHTTSLPTSPEASSSEDDDDDVFSYPATKPLVINKIHRRLHKKISCEELSGNLDEDYEYYTQEFNKIISLSSLYAPVHSQSSASRPESGCALPSTQKTRPKSLTIVRPPPRTSLPVPAEADEDGADVLLYYLEGISLSSGSHYSASESSSPSPAPEDDISSNVSLVDFAFDLDSSTNLRFPLSLPCSPIDLEADIQGGLEELRAKEEEISAQPSSNEQSFGEGEQPYYPAELEDGRVLRSRFSTSTLGSVKEERSPGPTLVKRVLPYFKGGKDKTKRSPSGRKRGNPFRSSVDSPTNSVFSPTASWFSQIDAPSLKRRTSTSTTGSGTSAESTSSSGLRRKPIPIEMFLRA
ncbi:uncharacterized protein EV420DRAFT_4424 [Desarmillaria tabescens]|uniref:Uncharacterized protein n=1 Tax=Armillaria tabescens TaxID=1929756 RepID=A0AA39NNR7_ARMTA|nr:uncharacterized protein EV420DRAFT_4424 [Desarmillaria tabescens]KAK0469036.1 hypothetical protein EV420DRAFT_4424 [Desarmillaria tabescens]